MSYIELNQVTFKYKGTAEWSLRDINLCIDEGEFIVLTGRSGCGKTTLTRCLNGLIPYFFKGEFSGDVSIEGTTVSSFKSYELAKKVGSIFQDPRSQFFATDTTAEVAFGCENLAMPSVEIQNRVAEAFENLHIRHLQDKSIFELSSGERQKIAIASVMAMSPAIYVLDEPAANLDAKGTHEFHGILRKLKEMGKTVIVSEHKLYYLMELCDRFVFMEKGGIKCVKSREVARKFIPKKIENHGHRAFYFRFLRTARQDCANLNSAHAADTIQVCNLSYQYKKNQVLDRLSFVARQGEIIGITGPNGAGKTTLVKILCGLLKEKSGKIVFNGKPVSVKKRTRMTYFVMQDADYQLFTESVENELRLGNERQPDINTKISETLDFLDLTRFRHDHPTVLSGGEKQKVTIAVANIKACDVIMFDEPTSGLDTATMKQIGQMIRQLSGRVKVVFVISHDRELLGDICSRILHMEKGTITDDFYL